MGLRGAGSTGRRGKKERKPFPKPWDNPKNSRYWKVFKFIESLPITSGAHAGRKFKLRKWQKRIIRDIYKTKGGKRQVRTAVLSFGRKNGKTSLAAALCLCHLVGPEAERRGQCYSAAADRDQAGLIFNEMQALIESQPWIKRRVNIKRFTKEIEDFETGSYYRALSSEHKSKLGFSASFVVFDELAAMPNRHLYDVLSTSTGARDEPLMLTISTQAADDHHVMSELVDYGLSIQRGEIEDESFYLSLYTAPDNCELTDEFAWKAANPALGDFRSEAEMRTAVQQAKRLPVREPAVRNLYLNQRVYAGESFIPYDEWNACKGTFTEKELYGRKCYGGLDLGSTRDLSSFSLFFPDGGELLSWSWCPQQGLQAKEDNDRVPYATWAAAGWIEPTPGAATDKRYLAIRLAQIVQNYKVQMIGFDRWGMAELKRIMDEEGITLPLKEFGQGFKDQGPAVRAFEEKILNRAVKQNGNPLLTWALSNVRPNTDPAGNTKLDKERAKERIDPIVASVMAIGLAAKEPGPRQYSFDKPLSIQF